MVDKIGISRNKSIVTNENISDSDLADTIREDVDYCVHFHDIEVTYKDKKYSKERNPYYYTIEKPFETKEMKDKDGNTYHVASLYKKSNYADFDSENRVYIKNTSNDDIVRICARDDHWDRSKKFLHINNMDIPLVDDKRIIDIGNWNSVRFAIDAGNPYLKSETKFERFFERRQYSRYKKAMRVASDVLDKFVINADEYNKYKKEQVAHYHEEKLEKFKTAFKKTSLYKAAEAVKDDVTKTVSEIRFKQEIKKNNDEIRNAAGLAKRRKDQNGR